MYHAPNAGNISPGYGQQQLQLQHPNASDDQGMYITHS